MACNPGLSSRLPSVSVYFSIVFTRLLTLIIVYPATISASGCPPPLPFPSKNNENENDKGIFRLFRSVFILSPMVLVDRSGSGGDDETWCIGAGQ